MTSLYTFPEGNVGIGTTTPGDKLDVNGGILSTSLKLTGAGGVTLTDDTNGSNLGALRITNNASNTNSSTMYYGNTGTWLATFYASNGTTYGYLDSAWGNWDTQKTVNGNLIIRVSSANRTVLHDASGLNATNLTSGTVPDARITGSYTGLTNLTGTGTVDFAKFLGNPGDTATTPSFSWTNDTTTGIYRPGTNNVAITTGGTNRVTVSTTAVTSTLPVSAFIYENSTTIASSYTITTNSNAMSAGPITINTGVTVTVPTGSAWSIV